MTGARSKSGWARRAHTDDQTDEPLRAFFDSPQFDRWGNTLKSVSRFFVVVAILTAPALAADNLVSVAPEHGKVLKEDAKVRVIEFSPEKGDKISMHSHHQGWC